MRHITGVVALALNCLMAAGVRAETGCIGPAEWAPFADAENDRVYINETAGSYLLEYQAPAGEDDKAQHISFSSTSKLAPGHYRFRTTINAGHANSPFTVSLEGAVLSKNKMPWKIAVKPNDKVTVNRLIDVKNDSVVTFTVGAMAFGKTWAQIGPTSFCPA